MRPVIGIVAARRENGMLAVWENYVQAVERAGGLAVLLGVTKGVDAASIAQWTELCSGFLMPGGGDIAPAYYGQSPLPQMGAADRMQDSIELNLCRAAARAGRPVLGICRGAQVINVAFGGTLWQDIPAQCRGAIAHSQPGHDWGEPFHSVALEPESRLAAVMGGAQQECNSFHHQAVRDVAPGFSAVAHAPDGVVEAIESNEGSILGVQWHPERLQAHYPEHAALFAWLVEAAQPQEI